MLSLGKEMKVVEREKNVHHDCVCFRELKFLPVPDEPAISELKEEELSDYCHLHGSLMNSFPH